jgi:hypothetical protein
LPAAEDQQSRGIGRGQFHRMAHMADVEAGLAALKIEQSPSGVFVHPCLVHQHGVAGNDNGMRDGVERRIIEHQLRS